MGPPAMSRRYRLASLLHHTGLVRAALAWRSSVPAQWVSILTYHRFPSTRGDEPFDDDVIDVTAAGFERQVACLTRHFTLVGVDELCAFAAGKPIPPNAVAITFDDGYLDNYEQALPILQRHGAKGIFFVPTASLTDRKLHWWDRVSYILKRSPLDHLTLGYPFKLELSLSNRALAGGRILRILKTHPALDLERFLDELAVLARVAWSARTEREFADQLLMTWDHARALRAAGMDVQSHTRTHRVLSTLPPAELLDELAGSRLDIARELGEPARAIAYPVGNQLDSGSPIRAVLAEAGYEIGLSSGTGANLVNEPVDRFNLRRQAVDLHVSEAYLLAMLAMPALAQRRARAGEVRIGS
jgi:peptidoglycan/xylan/chitin deacetylase (PgdA/CDA1 family)